MRVLFQLHGRHVERVIVRLALLGRESLCRQSGFQLGPVLEEGAHALSGVDESVVGVAALESENRVQVVGIGHQPPPVSSAVPVGRGVGVVKGELCLRKVVLSQPEVAERGKVLREGEVEARQRLAAQLVAQIFLRLQEHLLGPGRLAEVCVLQRQRRAVLDEAFCSGSLGDARKVRHQLQNGGEHGVAPFHAEEVGNRLQVVKKAGHVVDCPLQGRPVVACRDDGPPGGDRALECGTVAVGVDGGGQRVVQRFHVRQESRQTGVFPEAAPAVHLGGILSN